MLKLNEVIMDDIEQIIKREINFNWLKNRNVLISGANGLIASYLVNTLLYLNDTQDMGIQIYAIVRNREKTQKKWGDILDRTDIHRSGNHDRKSRCHYPCSQPDRTEAVCGRSGRYGYGKYTRGLQLT